MSARRFASRKLAWAPASGRPGGVGGGGRHGAGDRGFQRSEQLRVLPWRVHPRLRGVFRAGGESGHPRRRAGATGRRLSLRSYALLSVALDKVFQLTWFAVGAIIFWRRSDDRTALLVSVFLVSFGSVTVDTTGAEALISSQPAWWLPVRSVDVVGNACGMP